MNCISRAAAKLAFVLVAYAGASLFAATASAQTAAQTCAAPSHSGSSLAAFCATSYSVVQSTGSAVLTVGRAGGASAAGSVGYVTDSWGAKAGTNYTTARGTLQWAANDWSVKTITIPINKSAVFSGRKSFTVRLTNSGSGISIGHPGMVTVGINASQAASVGDLGFSAGTYNVAQNAGKVTATVNRSGSSNAAASVSYVESGGTAVAGKDFTAASGKLTWAAGDTAPKTISIPISNATPFTGSKSFSIALSAPSAGSAISSPSTATVAIAGSAVAAASTLALSASSYSMSATAPSASISIMRSGSATGAVTVNYATANGTAMAGTDYTATSSSVTWASGDASAKSVSVPLRATAAGKSFTFKLTGVSGAGTLATPNTASVAIASAPVATGALSISTSGNRFVDAKGNTLQLRGVNVSGLESGIIFDGSLNFWQSSGFSKRPDFTKIAGWKANAVRLPMNEDSWLGLTVTGVPGNVIALNGPAYQAEVKATVAAANAAGLYVILDLHWTAPGTFAANYQNPFMNADNSLDFWTSVATAFQGNPSVMFELFNEPFICPYSAGNRRWWGRAGVDANVGLSQGGTESYYLGLSSGTYGSDSTQVKYTYKTVGYQQVINAIRATGANNVIICGGNNYDDDLTWWATNPVTDPNNQLAAAVHQYPGMYPYNAATGPSGMNAMLAPITAKHPIILTEVGDEVGSNPAPFAGPVFAWADSFNYSVMAWTWNPWGGDNTLIQNSSTYTPTPGLGQTYYNWLLNHK